MTRGSLAVAVSTSLALWGLIILSVRYMYMWVTQ